MQDAVGGNTKPGMIGANRKGSWRGGGGHAGSAPPPAGALQRAPLRMFCGWAVDGKQRQHGQQIPLRKSYLGGAEIVFKDAGDD